jgi:hypothetical protein
MPIAIDEVIDSAKSLDRACKRGKGWRVLFCGLPLSPIELDRNRSQAKDLPALVCKKLIRGRILADLIVLTDPRCRDLCWEQLPQLAPVFPKSRLDSPEFPDELDRFHEDLEALEERVGRFDIGPRYLLTGNTPNVAVARWEVPEAARQAFWAAVLESYATRPEQTGLPQAFVHARSVLRRSKSWRHPHYWATWQLWGRVK